MKPRTRLLIALGVLVAGIITYVVKLQLAPADSQTAEVSSVALPRLLELGSTTCIPCQLMEDELEFLRNNYSGSLQVSFLDVIRNPDAGKPYGINVIPTQILYSPDGKELYRHEGFFSSTGITRTFKEFGYELAKSQQPEVKPESDGLLKSLFNTLNSAVKSYAALAVAAAFIWGVISVILSPCHLASIPLIVAFIDEQGRTTVKRAFVMSSLFATGILITIGIIGGITALTGRMLGDIGSVGNYLIAGIFLVVGLHFLDVIPMPWSGPGQVGMKRRGLLAAFILGLVFGIALGPCTFAFMAPMLGITLKLGSTQPLYAAALLLAYGIGHCVIIVLAGTFTEVIQKYLNWNESSHGAILLKKACAILVIAGGLFFIYKA